MGVKLILGIIFVLLGLSILLSNYDFVFGNVFEAFWPIVFILWGLARLREPYKSKLWSYFLILLGVLEVLGQTGLIKMDFFDILWPLLLITLGLWLIKPSKNSFRGWKPNFCKVPMDVKYDDTVSHFSLFSGIKSKVQSKNFLGGEVITIMGNSTLDLCNATMQEPQAVLSLFVVFGGIDIIVPTNWKIVMKGASVFGTINNLTHENEQQEEQNILIITGIPVFGGIKIMNVEIGK